MRSRSLGESFRFAFLGLSYALRTQRNMRLHFAAAVLVLIAAWVIGVGPVGTALLVLAMAGVIVAETINTALETVIDLISPGYHPLAGTAKNLAAAAVVIAAFFAVLIGLLVLGPQVLGLAHSMANQG